MTRGGARKNAGRKPDNTQAKRKVNASISPDVLAVIEQLAAKKRRSVSWTICELLTLATQHLLEKVE
jgi:hypothetical protein